MEGDEISAYMDSVTPEDLFTRLGPGDPDHG